MNICPGIIEEHRTVTIFSYVDVVVASVAEGGQVNGLIGVDFVAVDEQLQTVKCQWGILTSDTRVKESK